jgi:hypothetical protein
VWCEAPLAEETIVRVADAKKISTRTKAIPGSSLEAVLDRFIEPNGDAPRSCMGNRYIKSIAKLIAAWTKQ